MSQGSLEIRSGGAFESVEFAREENPGTLEERAQDFGSPLAPLGFAAEGVLEADLPLVPVELRGRSAQDGQIGVHDVARVWVLRRAYVAGGHDESRDAIGHRRLHAALVEDARRIGRAPRLVVPGARIVDEVVEPQRELPGIAVAQAVPRAVEERQDVRDVLERVVVAVRLRVRSANLLVKRTRVGARPEPPPERAPRLDRGPHCRHGGAKRSIADTALLDLPGGRT